VVAAAAAALVGVVRQPELQAATTITARPATDRSEGHTWTGSPCRRIGALRGRLGRDCCCSPCLSQTWITSVRWLSRAPCPCPAGRLSRRGEWELCPPVSRQPSSLCVVHLQSSRTPFIATISKFVPAAPPPAAGIRSSLSGLNSNSHDYVSGDPLSGDAIRSIIAEKKPVQKEKPRRLAPLTGGGGGPSLSRSSSAGSRHARSESAGSNSAGGSGSSSKGATKFQNLLSSAYGF
jgi:hypothetical protein